MMTEEEEIVFVIKNFEKRLEEEVKEFRKKKKEEIKEFRKKKKEILRSYKKIKKYLGKLKMIKALRALNQIASIDTILCHLQNGIYDLYRKENSFLAMKIKKCFDSGMTAEECANYMGFAKPGIEYFYSLIRRDWIDWTGCDFTTVSI